MPVVVSVLIFIIYYIINNTGYKMARDGKWIVWMGMWTSTAVLAPLGAFLTYKSNNDSVVLNADAYVNWFKKIAGIRSVRHLFRKEVIIHDPDYVRLPGELQRLSADCRAYAEKKTLMRAPNYFRLWMNDAPHDEEVVALNERLETLKDEMSNTRSIPLLTALNNYPVIAVHAHVRPFRNYWLNMLCGAIVPVGLFFYFRIWAFRIRLNKDMERIIHTNEEIQNIIKVNQNKDMEKVKLNTIEEAIEDFKAGNFVIVVDDEDRENEGDLIIAAEKITSEKVNFMLKHARGVLCAPITVSRCKELDLPHQVTDNTSVLGTPFTVTVDKLEGCTTGVSAADRAATIQALADPLSTPATFGRPGHINPLYAQEKGVLRRAGHTEATIDMCRLSGFYPAGALMEIMNEDGTMARLPELRKMADEFNLKLISIRDMIAYRLQQESIVEKGVEVDMPTEHGHFRLIPFRQKSNGLEHVALFKGTWAPDEPVLVRVHSSCATGDIFGSMRCDCGEQLHKAMEVIEKAGKGVIVYLNQEGRGIGLMEKMRAYKLQEDGMDTVDANICLGHLADERDYGVGAQILRELGVHKMRLLTNNPVKRVGLEAYGLEIVENVPVETTPNQYNERYLRTKKERMGHTLHFSK